MKVYLVGDKNAPKTNSWEHMTNDWSLVDGLKAALGEGSTHKVVTVNQPRSVRK